VEYKAKRFMPQKQKAKCIFFAKPSASPDSDRDAELAFSKSVKKFATDMNERSLNYFEKNFRGILFLTRK